MWGGLVFQGEKGAAGEPFGETIGPVGDRTFHPFAQTEAVADAGEDVQFGGGTRAFEAQIGFREPFGNILPVLVPADEEGRR